MRRKRRVLQAENHDRWLVSYSDFITLLFAFFVVMFASSQTDKARAQAVSDSVREALSKGGIAAAVHEILGGTVDEKGKGNAMMKGPGGAQRVNPANIKREAASPERSVVELLPSMQYLNRELQNEIQTGKIQVSLQPRGLVVSLRETAFFPSGEDVITPSGYPTIGKIAQTIRSLPSPVRLEGHTDSVPIHTARFRSNWELSAARGIAMMELLATRFEVPPQRMAIAGYADTVPVASNDTAEGRAHNRRVDVVILSQLSLMKEPPVAATPAPAPGAPARPNHPR